MSKAKVRKVSSVRRMGPDYEWFILAVEGLKTLHVPDDVVSWEVDDRKSNTMAHVRKGYYKVGESPRRLEVKRVRIIGPRQQLANLQASLGNATPEQPVSPHW